jgi:peptidoglycan hydrolase-like protein with peptidoglycan-binding domain
VTVTVPYPEKTSQSTSAAAPAVKDLAGGDEALYIICTTDMSTMPILRNESSDAWGASVAQTVLYVMGYYESVSDGIYGPITRAAVKAFQRDAGIIVDGLVGPQTWTALQSSHCADFPYE